MMTFEHIEGLIAEARAREREACASIAESEVDDPDCNKRAALDMNVPCFAEACGGVCTCAKIAEASKRVAKRIRARSTSGDTP